MNPNGPTNSIGNAPAFPFKFNVRAGDFDPILQKTVDLEQVHIFPGMTTRAYIATKAMAAMINAEWSAYTASTRITPQAVAQEACQYADALIAELSKQS